MTMTVVTMPKKREGEPEPAPKKGVQRGRPKGAGRITSRYAIVATPEYRAWMEAFLDHIGETEVSDAFREAIKRYAEATKFRPPPKR